MKATATAPETNALCASRNAAAGRLMKGNRHPMKHRAGALQEMTPPTIVHRTQADGAARKTCDEAQSLGAGNLNASTVFDVN